MKILLASPRGFCAGVNMAIESLELAIKLFGTPVYVYHEIVHNKYVVETLPRRGRRVRRSARAKCPTGATLLYSAHGVSPEIRRVARERKLQTIDATCPLVTKVHLEAIRYAKRGLHDRAHRPRRARRSDRHDGRSARGDRAGRIARGRRPAGVADRHEAGLPDADDALGRRRQPDHRPPAGSAFRTSSARRRKTSATPRRTARRRCSMLAREADVVLVLGSQNSSNSQRLAELARETRRAGLPDRRRRRHRPGLVRRRETVLITAGASAPEIGRRGVRRVSPQERFDATVEARDIREEDVHFPLPKELRAIGV